jgi:hypothetical protein
MQERKDKGDLGKAALQDAWHRKPERKSELGLGNLGLNRKAIPGDSSKSKPEAESETEQKAKQET